MNNTDPNDHTDLNGRSVADVAIDRIIGAVQNHTATGSMNGPALDKAWAEVNEARTALLSLIPGEPDLAGDWLAIDQGIAVAETLALFYRKDRVEDTGGEGSPYWNDWQAKTRAVDAARAALTRLVLTGSLAPRVVLIISGGVLTDVSADRPVEVVLADYDVEGSEEDEGVHRTPDRDGDGSHTGDWTPCQLASQYVAICPDYVTNIFRDSAAVDAYNPENDTDGAGPAFDRLAHEEKAHG